MSESRRTDVHILLSQIWDSPHLEARLPYLYSPGRGWPVIPPDIAFLFRRFYEAQGYGGGDLNPPPRPGGPVCDASMNKFETDRIKKPPPTVPSIFAFVFVAEQAWTGRDESHATTEGQSASPPRKKTPIWAHDQASTTVRQSRTRQCWAPHPEERTIPPPTTTAGPRQSFNLGSESSGTRDCGGTHTALTKLSYFTTGGLPPISSSWRQAPNTHDETFF
jgi:hypothetical protein